MTEQDKYFAEPNTPTIIYIGSSGASAKYYPIGELLSFLTENEAYKVIELASVSELKGDSYNSAIFDELAEIPAKAFSFNIDPPRRQGKGERKRNKQNRWR